jgi:hypothetical protein
MPLIWQTRALGYRRWHIRDISLAMSVECGVSWDTYQTTCWQSHIQLDLLVFLVKIMTMQGTGDSARNPIVWGILPKWDGKAFSLKTFFLGGMCILIKLPEDKRDRILLHSLFRACPSHHCHPLAKCSISWIQNGLLYPIRNGLDTSDWYISLRSWKPHLVNNYHNVVNAPIPTTTRFSVSPTLSPPVGNDQRPQNAKAGSKSGSKTGNQLPIIYIGCRSWWCSAPSP